ERDGAESPLHASANAPVRNDPSTPSRAFDSSASSRPPGGRVSSKTAAKAFTSDLGEPRKLIGARRQQRLALELDPRMRAELGARPYADDEQRFAAAPGKNRGKN